MTADAALLVDRFVSATSATDAHTSLQALLDGLTNETIPPEIIYQDDGLLEAFLQVLSTASYKDVPLEEGVSLVCRIYKYLFKQDGAATILLEQPSPGRLFQSLLDLVSSDTTNHSDYTRVLGLQILNQACSKAPPSLAQAQLLEIPNGLHRLADILSLENHESVRNELLGGVSQKIAKWPSCAKIWVFGDVCNVLLEIAIQEGGLTKGNVLVGDCLSLVESLVDPSLADLIWASPIVAPKLAALLDLRGGTEFLFPPKPQQVVSQQDDLDDILATGNKTTLQEQQQVLPKLTYKEENVVKQVLSILRVLLDNPTLRPSIWKQHSPLCSLLWELALVSRPPSNTKPVCALPSPSLQQAALEFVGMYVHDVESRIQHYGVDRLLFLVCTGGASGNTVKEKMGLSQAALYVLRQTLPQDEARDVLTRTLAPPMNVDDDKPPLPTVVQKLLNTVYENITTTFQEQQEEGDRVERRRINLVGAFGALTIFLNSPTDREVMLGITTSSNTNNLVDTLLQCLEQQEDEMICLAVLKFACEWVQDSPSVVQAFLASTSSVVLSTVLVESGRGSVVGTMVGFLLGLLLKYMSNDKEDENKHGGWTRSSIMELLSKRRGISGYTTGLEQLKSKHDDVLPWKACSLEWDLFSKWYSSQVLAIRKCVVQELTSSSGEIEEDDDGDVGANSNASVKSLNRLVSQQAQELEELRESLSEAKATIESQEGQLSVWKRRVESTPTQLDEMLTEYTSKNAEMEKQVSSLKKQIGEKEASVQTQVQERDDEIEQLQTKVQELESREIESRQERDDLRGELQGLTSAYATLEQEYHQREAPAQGAAPAQQAEGEVSHQEQTSGPELGTLRAENARLRSDAQAADEWMAMAVQRMNDIGGQNQTLQQELTTLQGQMQQAQLTGGIVAPIVTGITQEQLDEERQRREQLEQRLAEAGTTNSSLETEIRTLRQQLEENSAQAVDAGVIDELKRRLAEEESLRQALESQLQNAQRDTSTAMDSLGGSKSEKERLERALAGMEDELRGARSEIDALREEREQRTEQSTSMTAAMEERDTTLASKDGELESVRSLVASKDEELVGLRQQLTESRERVESGLDSPSQEITSLRDNVQSLSEELEKARKEVDEITRREREEIQMRDAKIRELESPQNQQQSRDVPPSGTDGRDEEIKSLREANEAAQEWMAKAVEHHQMLSEQVSALTEDKAALTKEINVLEQSASSSSVPDSSRETMDRLERELSDRTAEATDLGARIIKLESELRIKETEMEGVQEKIAQCEQLQMEVNSLEDSRDTELEKARSLEDKVSQIVLEKEALSTQLDSLRQELNEKDELVATSTGLSSKEVDSLKQLLKEREVEMDRLRDELETAKDAFADVEQLRITLKTAEDESSRLRVELDDAQSSLLALKDKTASFESLQAEVQTMRETSSQLEVVRDVKHASSVDESLTIERDKLKETVSQLESQLSEFQTWADAAQVKIAELQNEKEALEQEKKPSERDVDDATVSGLRDEIASAKLELASLTTERDALKDTATQMESQLSEFQSWADAAQLKITELQEEKEAIEQEMKTTVDSNKDAESATIEGLRDDIASSKRELDSLTTERDALKEAATQMESQMSEFQSWSEAAQLKITELQEEKEAIEQEMKTTVDSNKDAESATIDGLRDDIASSKRELDSLTTERDALKEAATQMESQMSEFQSWSEAAQLKITELQEEKEAIELVMKTAVESEKEARKQLDSFREEMELKSTELSSALQENDELKALRADLDSQLARTKLESDELLGKISSLEDDVTALETQRSGLLERASQAESAVKTKEDALRAMEESAAELQSALETIQEQSAGIIDEWKAQVEELESTVVGLEEALQQQQVEASDAVEQWSARWAELDSLKSDLERHLETVSNERDELSEMLQRERENGGKEALAQVEIERNTERADWDAEKDRLQDQINKQNEALSVSSQNVESANEELTRMKATAEETVEAWKGRVSEMEGIIGDLEEELSQRRDEAAEAISQWESHCGEVEERAEALERELQAVSKEKDEVKLSALSMEQSIEPLGEQLEEERAVRLRLEKENEAAMQQIDDSRTQFEDVVNQWEARVEDLESSVVELESQLEVQQEEATKAIAQWESSYSDLENRAMQLEEDLARASGAADRSLNEELRGRAEEILSLKSQLGEVQKDHVESQERSRELESMLEVEREALQATKLSLESKQSLAETLEAELLQLREEVESDASETRAALALERAARDAAEKDLSILQETVSETEEAFVDLCSKEEQVFSGSSQAKEDAARMQQMLEAKEAQWENERENFSREKDLLVQERDDLRAAVGELQEELRDAGDALQACVTDEVSEKAAEVASQALRYQMERLRSQIERDQEACARERNIRLAAEKEVEALKMDLSNVLGVMDGESESSTRVQRMTMRASETMQRRGREEMEEVRKALERALQDLASAQAAEEKASEDAASSRLQLSVCEQEVLAAKSDLAFLTQTLEETREAEASKAASLEYRISSLEDDREVLRQFHQDELENLRNEVTHVSMEKDRILHSLKESEKKNAALVFSTAKKRESDGSTSPEAELSRLRVEKAQLLTAATEEGSLTESRIREAVAAHVSSMEADVILERELRVAAEAAVEDIKFQMEELKSAGREDESRQPSGGNMDDSRSESILDELSAELKRFKEESRSLSADNAALRNELETANEQSEAKIVELTDKWRKAQAKAHMLEGSEQFDAEVNVEVAKLRANGGEQEQRNWIVVHDNPVEDDGPGISSVEAYDLIQKQKIAIQEERAMYLELLAEHDDLLALLAQQDLEKASLNAALSGVAGKEAVDAAMTDAEEKALQQYGKYVKVTS